MTSHYETLTGRRIDLGVLSQREKQSLQDILRVYKNAPKWTDFSVQWQKKLAEALPAVAPAKRVRTPLYTILQDLELRLGISQGEVAPPDYRDFIVERIEEKFGSRYKFCHATEIPEAFLSQVLSGKKDFSLSKLRQVAEALDLGVVLLPVSDLADVPVTDVAAMRRVSSLIDGEIATLRSALDHFGRIKDPVRRAKMLEEERELFETVLDRISDRLAALTGKQRGEQILSLIQDEMRGLESFLAGLRLRIAKAAEPVDRASRGGIGNAFQTVSRV